MPRPYRDNNKEEDYDADSEYQSSSEEISDDEQVTTCKPDNGLLARLLDGVTPYSQQNPSTIASATAQVTAESLQMLRLTEQMNRARIAEMRSARAIQGDGDGEEHSFESDDAQEEDDDCVASDDDAERVRRGGAGRRGAITPDVIHSQAAQTFASMIGRTRPGSPIHMGESKRRRGNDGEKLMDR